MFSRFSLATLLLLVALCAHAQAPAAPAALKATLDQAAALEHQGRFTDALVLYRQALSISPNSRDALLGVARVARARYRLDEASAIYSDLLRRNPRDAEALNGLAWVAMANNDASAAASGFNQALAIQPANAEARVGLEMVPRVHRYRLDITGGALNNTDGTSWGAGADFTAWLDARNSIELGLRHNTRELRTSNPLDATTLPSNAARVGYRWQIPSQFGVGIAYENRERENDPVEHRVEITGNATLAPRVTAFGGVRKGYGTGWDSTMSHLGVSAGIGGPWDVVATVFAQHRPGFPSARALVLDAVRQGPGDALVLVGIGHGSDPSLTDVHAHVVYPVSADGSLLFTGRYNTLRHESQLEFGWRQYWK